MVFALLLRYFMNQKGMNQSALAEASNINQSLISEYLSGNFKPRKKKLQNLADALGIDVEMLDLSCIEKNNQAINEAIDFFMHQNFIEFQQVINAKTEEEILIAYAFNFEFEVSGIDFCELYYIFKHEIIPPTHVKEIIRDYVNLLADKRQAFIIRERSPHTNRKPAQNNVPELRSDSVGRLLIKFAEYTDNNQIQWVQVSEYLTEPNSNCGVIQFLSSAGVKNLNMVNSYLCQISTNTYILATEKNSANYIFYIFKEKRETTQPFIVPASPKDSNYEFFLGLYISIITQSVEKSFNALSKSLDDLDTES